MPPAPSPVRFAVRAHPGAHRQRVELLPDGAMGVWVRARAVEGRANAAIERTLAAALGLRPRQVVLVSGQAGRQKLVEISQLDQDQVRTRLVGTGVARALRPMSPADA